MSAAFRPTRWQRLLFWLERNHGWRNAIVLGLIVSVSPWLLAFFIGGPASASMTEVEYRSVDQAISEIATVAQITGGVYAILLAVVVFSVQLHAQREDENALMVRYLIRRHGVYWISGLAVGVTLCNALAPVFHTFGWRFNLPTILASDLVLTPASLALSLWLLVVTIRDATSPTFDSSFGTFKRDMTRAVAVDQYNAALIAAFANCLKNTRIEYDTFTGWPSLRERQWRMNCHIPAGRYVADVNLDKLRELDEVLRGLPSECKMQFALAPGELSDAGPCFILSCDRPKNDLKADPPVAKQMSSEKKQQIDALVAGVFITDDEPIQVSEDLNEFLKRFRDRLASLVKDGDAVQFATALERLEALVKHWSKLATDTEPGTSPFWNRNPGQRFAGPLAVDLRDVVVACMDSKDRDKAETILMFLSALFSEGVRVGHLRLTSDAGWLIPLAHYHGTLNKRIRHRVSSLVDSSAHVLLMSFAARQSRWERSTDEQQSSKAEQELPFLERGVAMVLSLIRTALERGLNEEAENFTDRLFSYRQHDDPYQPNEVALVAEDGDSLHIYSMIILIGWTVHILQSGQTQCLDAAERVLKEVIKLLPSREQVIAVWELYHRQSPREAAIDQRLGVAQWEFPSPGMRRSGVVYTSSRKEWLPQGFYATALLAPSIHSHSESKFFSRPPWEHLWNSELDRRRLAAAAELSWLGIKPEQREAEVGAVAALLSLRERTAKVTHFERMSSAIVDSGRKESVVRTVREHATKKPMFLEIIESVGIGTRAPAQRLLPKIVAAEPIPFSSLTGEAIGGDVGAWIGEQVAEQHNAALQTALDGVATVGNSIATMVELPAAVEAAVELMVRRGYSPNLIAVPWEGSVGAALLKRRLWQWEGNGLQTPWSCGRWHGLHVIRLARGRLTSVVVLESSRFFGRPENATCDVTIDGPHSEQVEVLRVRASTATTPGEVPDADEIQVNVAVELAPHLGIIDLEAAVAVDITNANGGYALLPNDNIYHRARCQKVEHHDDVRFSLTKRLQEDTTERRACEVCTPD